MAAPACFQQPSHKGEAQSLGLCKCANHFDQKGNNEMSVVVSATLLAIAISARLCVSGSDGYLNFV